MKRTKKAIICIAVVVAGAGALATGWAMAQSPGSETDPVVTKSYVDQKLSEVGASYVAVEIKAGQKVIGGEGTEIILRSGEATAIGSENNGISDLTAGVDLMTGQVIELNHMLLVPRADGRGIAAGTDGWIMIRGSYSIQ